MANSSTISVPTVVYVPHLHCPLVQTLDDASLRAMTRAAQADPDLWALSQAPILRTVGTAMLHLLHKYRTKVSHLYGGRVGDELLGFGAHSKRPTRGPVFAVPDYVRARCGSCRTAAAAATTATAAADGCRCQLKTYYYRLLAVHCGDAFEIDSLTRDSLLMRVDELVDAKYAVRDSHRERDQAQRLERNARALPTALANSVQGIGALPYVEDATSAQLHTIGATKLAVYASFPCDRAVPRDLIDWIDRGSSYTNARWGCNLPVSIWQVMINAAFYLSIGLTSPYYGDAPAKLVHPIAATAPMRLTRCVPETNARVCYYCILCSRLADAAVALLGEYEYQHKPDIAEMLLARFHPVWLSTNEAAAEALRHAQIGVRRQAGAVRQPLVVTVVAAPATGPSVPARVDQLPSVSTQKATEQLRVQTQRQDIARRNRVAQSLIHDPATASAASTAAAAAAVSSAAQTERQLIDAIREASRRGMAQAPLAAAAAAAARSSPVNSRKRKPLAAASDTTTSMPAPPPRAQRNATRTSASPSASKRRRSTPTGTTVTITTPVAASALASLAAATASGSGDSPHMAVPSPSPTSAAATPSSDTSEEMSDLFPEIPSTDFLNDDDVFAATSIPASVLPRQGGPSLSLGGTDALDTFTLPESTATATAAAPLNDRHVAVAAEARMQQVLHDTAETRQLRLADVSFVRQTWPDRVARLLSAMQSIGGDSDASASSGPSMDQQLQALLDTRRVMRWIRSQKEWVLTPRQTDAICYLAVEQALVHFLRETSPVFIQTHLNAFPLAEQRLLKACDRWRSDAAASSASASASTADEPEVIPITPRHIEPDLHAADIRKPIDHLDAAAMEREAKQTLGERFGALVQALRDLAQHDESDRAFYFRCTLARLVATADLCGLSDLVERAVPRQAMLYTALNTFAWSTIYTMEGRGTRILPIHALSLKASGWKWSLLDTLLQREHMYPRLCEQEDLWSRVFQDAPHVRARWLTPLASAAGPVPH